MGPQEYKELCDLLKMRESSAAVYAKGVLSCYNYDITHVPGQYIWAVPKGADYTPVCLVAHLDTVRPASAEPVTLTVTKETVMNENGVLGADDRSGVAIALQVVRRLDKLPYILLTHGEERGCIGAKKFVKDNAIQGHEDAIFGFIEYDRRGFNELVTYGTRVPVDYKALFLAYGYEEKRGSNSDVATLSEATGIAHVNLSAGYIDQHSKRETLFPRAVDFAVTTATEVIPLISEPYLLDPVVTTSTSVPRRRSNTAGGFSPFGPYTNGETRNTRTCALCGEQSENTSYYASVKGSLCMPCKDMVISQSDNGYVTAATFHKVRKLLAEAESPAEEEVPLGSPDTTCPRCGSMSTNKTGAQSYSCPDCGKGEFYIANDVKTWYTYNTYSDKGDEVIRHQETYMGLSRKAKEHARTCSSCGKTRPAMPIKLQEGDLWYCTRCAKDLFDNGVIDKDTLVEGLRIRKLINS